MALLYYTFTTTKVEERDQKKNFAKLRPEELLGRQAGKLVK